MGWKALKLRLFSAALAMLSAPAPFATGDLTCAIDDADVGFTFPDGSTPTIDGRFKGRSAG
jgi:hypothetical protein